MNKNRTLSFATAALLTAIPLSVFAETKNVAASKGINLLEQTSQTFTHIAKKAMPATVFIKVQQQSPEPERRQAPHNPFGDEFFRRFFGTPFGSPQQYEAPQQQQQMAGGSGFFVSADGYIVTNFHVVKEASQITVVLNDGREYTAAISGTDPRTDLAVLKINETDLPYLTFGSSDDLEIGEWVVAIGTPFALEASLTVGVVSAKGRQDLGITSLEDFIQTDAAINPGNSGGPLLDLNGNVVGVNTAIISRSGGYMGIGFSIPSRMAQHVIDQIIHSGTVQRAYLGIILQPIDKDLADALGLDKAEGILVSEVVKDSPAAKGGLLQGDVILQYNQNAAKNVSKLRNEIAMMSPGAEINLKVLRNNRPLQLTIGLGSQTEVEVVSAETIQKMGLEVETLTPELAVKLNFPSDLQGAVITKVKPGSPAQAAGLRPSFLITGIALNWNEPKRVVNSAEFNQVLQEVGNHKHIILIVRHQNYQRYYTMKLN